MPRLLVILLVSILFTGPVRAEDKTSLWDLKTLRKTPKATFTGKGEIRGVYFESEPYKGKATRVFAWLGIPAKAKGKVPGVVLLHGGGGTAFKQWVELWVKRGYAAIAMDFSGRGPDGKRLADGGPGQGDAEKFHAGATVKDYWTYHAIAAIIRATSLLAAQPEVDADKLAVTGISWGGYLTCITAGVDDRFKAAVPVYGCGFIHENSAWNGIFKRFKADQKKRWVDHFEPSKYLPSAKMPVLFVNGTNDFAYPLDSYQKSYRQVKNRELCVTVRMPHSHPAGWAPVEIGLFIDQHLIKGKPLPKVTSAKRTGDSVEVTFEAKTTIKAGGLHYTTDSGSWQNRKWQTLPLKIDGNKATATLPKGRPLVYFATITDDRKATASSEHEVVEK